MKKGLTYKNTGIPWLGDVPAHWEVVKVKHRYHFQTGFTPETKNDTYYDDDGHNWVTIADINANKSGYIAESSTRISQAFVDKFSPKIVPAESLLYSFKLSVGKTAIAKTDLYTNEAIAAFPPDNPCVSFLKYSCSQLINAANENIYGTKILNSSLISNAQIVFPPLTEQRAIATFLDEKTAQLDGAIESVEKSVELLRELRAATISEAVTRGLNAHAPLRDSGVPWIGEVPRHWEVRRVKHLCSCWNGLTYSPDDMSDDGIIVLRSGNIQNGKINLDDVVQVSMDIPEKAKAKKGDILICSRNGSKKLIGKNALITEDGYAFGAFMMIARPNIDSRYFYYLLNSEVFSYYLPTYLTSTVNQLTSSNFGNMYVPVTYNVAEQQEIARYLDEKTAQIDSLVSAKQHQVQLLRELRASVIAEAVTGKLGIRE